jgi:hypothetical protein
MNGIVKKEVVIYLHNRLQTDNRYVSIVLVLSFTAGLVVAVMSLQKREAQEILRQVN